MKLLFSFLFLLSCANTSIISKSKGEENKVIVKEEIKFSSAKLSVQNGKAKYAEFTTPQVEGSYHLNCVEQGTNKPLKQKIPYFVRGNKGMTYYAESYFSQAKQHHCFYKNNLVLDVVVTKFPYKKEKLNVDKRRVDISKKDLARVRKERTITANLYKNSVPYLLFEEDFMVPLNSYITSHYGNQRIFNNKKRSQHLGNDFRAKVGVQIPVSNKGKVVFVGDLFYTGNVVIIDHGLRIFSLYAHLSKTLVTTGSILNKGDIVGLSGKTGRVSGPHLHWGIKINGHNIDGFSLVDESKKQFSANESTL